MSNVALVRSRAQLGLAAPQVMVEVHLTSGLPAFNLVGLAETAVRESRERVRSAILSAGFEFPNRRITVNLAPADLPKEGTRFDLAIALGILSASGQLPASALEGVECLAELALTARLRPVRGILPAALAARAGGRALLCAEENAEEVMLCAGVIAHAAGNLAQICAHLSGAGPLSPLITRALPPTPAGVSPDLAEVRGQSLPRRALEIAAAGGHNLLMVGPPGTGKTMLAMRLPGLLPPLESETAIETATLHSLAGRTLPPREWRVPPFRSPHHTASAIALIGGGNIPRPGEVSLAHQGVLFLDELTEFDRRALEALREPLESGQVTVSRAGRQAMFPACFQLVVAMNPCPCGYLGDPSGRCACDPQRVARYLSRVSGPLLDRIDLQLEVAREPEWLREGERQPGESSATVAARVAEARDRQLARQGCINARLTPARMLEAASMPGDTARLLEEAFTRFQLSPRSYHRVVRVARTIADLEGVVHIRPGDVAEALSLRRLDLLRGTQRALYAG